MIKFQKRYFFLSILIFLIEVIIALYIKDAIIRPYGGDYLVVILIYCFVKSFLHIDSLKAAIGVLIFSYLVEFSQYLNLIEIIGLQDNRTANIIIGNSFSWIDMIVYTLGIGTVIFLEKFGSIKKDRSSGWIEQETGRRSNKDRVATIMGRSGSESKQIKPSIRLKQGRRFKSAQDFEPNGSVGRTLMMLMKLKREKYKKPFVVRRRNKYKRRGMYKFVRGKAKLLYAFNTKKVRPARVVWLRGGSRVDNNKNNIRDRWGVAIEKQLQPRIGK